MTMNNLVSLMHNGQIKFFSCHYAESQQKMLPLHLNFCCCTLQKKR